MPKYATQTTVSVENSKREIETTLKKYGADQFIYGWDAEQVVIGFRISDRHVKVLLPMPTVNHADVVRDPAGRLRGPAARNGALEQLQRQRWRALLLVIKAKLEAVECQISTIDREFLADTVMADGRTVGEWAEPQIAEMYKSGRMPSLLPTASRLAIEA